jgi:hypothetical protein
MMKMATAVSSRERAKLRLPQQALFDAADGLVEQLRLCGRKSDVAALQDATVLKTMYAFGLRRSPSRPCSHRAPLNRQGRLQSVTS